MDGTEQWQQWVTAAAQVRIQIDLPGRAVPVGRRWVHPLLVGGIAMTGPISRKSLGRFDLAGQLLYEVEPGIDGLVLRSGKHEAVVLPSDPVTHGWLTPRVQYRTAKLEALLNRLSELAGGPQSLWSQAESELYKFRSFSFGRPVPDAAGGAMPLYRGNVIGDAPDSDAILAGIEEAGRWLRQGVKSDGRFRYEYFANQDHYPDAYNDVRHAGCVYGLYFLYRLALREPALLGDAHDTLEAAIRSAHWLYPRLRAPKGADDTGLVALVEPGGNATSGAAALTLLSFLERPAPADVSHPALREQLERPEDGRIVEGLGRFLLAMIDDRGKVFHNYHEMRRSDRVAEEPLYFPGEVMLALARLHRTTGDERWLDGAKRVGEARIRRYYRERPNPDHWVMQAMWELFDLTKDERYADVGLDMGDRHASEQFPRQWAPFADYVGAYRRGDDVPRTTRACSRSEAMGGVVRIAWRLGADATPYEDALLGAADHLLENQWRPANSFYLPNPERARGAIRMGLVDNHCRIDNNQHALVGLAHALLVARRREGTYAPPKIVLPPPPDEAEIATCRRRFSPPPQPAPTSEVEAPDAPAPAGEPTP
ncbi:MAG: hypothetical protein JRI23_31355 [Deltaproteobacteria bacterium]|nr:hypothetical protein [Deltaproteobacteria bacterium]MBW2536707.1 hypothetical protein [Deltaproteobacteria bacterium]